MSSSSITKTPGPALARWIGTITLAALVWVAAYTHLTEFADLLVGLLGLERGTRTAEAVHFFLFDTPKVLLLLTGRARSQSATPIPSRPGPNASTRRGRVSRKSSAAYGLM